jgi:hypothetical protein
MTITVSQITSLVGRYTNEVVNEQVNEESPFVGKGTLKRVKKPDKIGIVNVKAGELSSVAFLADAATLPSGGDVQPVQGTYSPIGLFGRISLPRIAAKLASSLDDGIDLVKEEMESCGQTLARQLARGVFGSSLGSPTAATSAGATTFTVASPSAWRVGMAFEIANGATPIEGSTEATLLRVSKIDMPANGVGDTTITFTGTGTGAGSNVAWTTGYTFWLRGANANRMTSLADVCAASSLYGLSQNSNEWSGTLDSTSTELTIPTLRSLLTTTIRRRGARPDYIVSNRKNEERYSNLLINNRRFMGGKMDAVGGSSFELEGVPWITDENVDDTDVFFFNQKDVVLHEFQDFQPEIDGAQKKGMNMGAALISDTALIYDIQVLGIFNLRCVRRNGTARLSALAA